MNQATLQQTTSVMDRLTKPVLARLPAPIIFDAANKAHRMAFAQFLNDGRWAPDAPRFEVELPHTSAVTTIQTKLMHFALHSELVKLDRQRETFIAAVPVAQAA
jgi:hypothetical protein